MVVRWWQSNPYTTKDNCNATWAKLENVENRDENNNRENDTSRDDICNQLYFVCDHNSSNASNHNSSDENYYNSRNNISSDTLDVLEYY